MATTASHSADFPLPLAAALGVFLAAQALSSIVPDIALIMLAIWMLRGPEQTLQSLSLLVVIKFLSPAVVHLGSVSGTLIWALPLVVGFRILPLVRAGDLKLVAPVLLFAAAAALCSIVGSPALTISLMKAATFAWVIASVLVAYQRLPADAIDRMGAWMRALGAAVAALSLLLLAVRPGATLHAGLFQGVFSHPQALGVFLAPFVAAYVASWAFEGKRLELRAALTLGLLTVVMLLTRSRTAAIAVILGCLLATFGGRSHASRERPARELSRAAGLLFAGMLVLLALEAGFGRVSSSISDFVLKGGEQEVGTAFAASRGKGIAAHVDNFLSSPIVGRGFGVPADGHFDVAVRTVFGLPISAPTEKGFLPAGVLEETGVIGFSVFAYMIFALGRAVWRRTHRPAAAMLFTCLFVNIGEAILFSPGGLGLHIWLLIGLALQAPASAMTEMPSIPPADVAGRPYVNLID